MRAQFRTSVFFAVTLLSTACGRPSSGPASAPRCGDGIVQGDEECDDGNQDDTDGCLSTCKSARCGDGFVQAGVEECDDGNQDNNDACLNTCKSARCGDAVVQTGVEECDDGNQDNNDACLNTCKAARCGDAFVQTGVEECDDGNPDNNDACLNTCKAARCGDAFVLVGAEECDDGNQDNNDACLNTCKAARCGDGFVLLGVEQCDDGNTVAGDSCGASCESPKLSDADGDTISDFDEGMGLVDTDGDGIPDSLDTDSDNDGVPDKCEARANPAATAADLSKALLDTNGDGIMDYLTRDSDGDTLADGKEDLNGNCLVDSNETDRIKADTDGDGIDDMVEVALLGVAAAKDPASTPAKAGMLYFVLPYTAAGMPASAPIGLDATVSKVDLGFVVDTTGSMGGTLANLKTGVSSTVIPALRTKISDLGVGIAGHDDFPIAPYGGAGTDLPFYVAAPPNGYVTTVIASTQIAANSLVTHFGNDNSESQIPAMFKALTGAALTWPGGQVAADAPPAGTFGALRFRTGGLPILISLTDVSFHNGLRALDKTGTTYDTAIQDPYAFAAPNAGQLVAQINALGAKFIGGAADNGTRGMGVWDPYGHQAFLADKTGSLVPPAAFGAGSTTCPTGVSGAALPPDGPTVGGVQQCRLVFSYNSMGTGLSNSIPSMVSALLASLQFDLHSQAYNDPAELIDVVGSFLSSVGPLPAGGIDPITAKSCSVFSSIQLADRYHSPKAFAGAGDVLDTLIGANQGSTYCFNLVPARNMTVPPLATPQVFRAWVKPVATSSGGATLSVGIDRQVFFIVPPTVI